MRNKVFLIIIILISIFSVGNVGALTSNKLSEEYQLELYKAKVLEVIDVKKMNKTVLQTLRIEILNKEYKGIKAEITNTLTGNTLYDIKLKRNDLISVHAEINDNNISFYLISYDRTNYIFILLVIFMICIIALGGIKGIKALTALGITILLIMVLLVPLLLNGYNPILISVLTCILATFLTFIITSGFSRKSFSAILGTIGGLLIGGLIAYLFGVITKLNGFSSNDAQMLLYLPNQITFNFKGLLFAGIVIGALGACMDVSISISSSLTEIKSRNPDITSRELIKSGFNIGKDIMGTMINTLVLAYTGSSLSTILIFSGFQKTTNEIINLDSVASEIIRAIAGSLGLLFAIPLTIFAFIFISNLVVRSDKGEKQN